jgi:hypothetical protein
VWCQRARSARRVGVLPVRNRHGMAARNCCAEPCWASAVSLGKSVGDTDNSVVGEKNLAWASVQE